MEEKELDAEFFERMAKRSAEALKSLEAEKEGIALIKILQQNMKWQDRKIERIEENLKKINEILKKPRRRETR